MRSIERHLAVWVLGAASLGLLLLMLVAYLGILEDLNETLDQNLRQVAQSVTVIDTSSTRADRAAATAASREGSGEWEIVVLKWTPDGQLGFSSNTAVALRFEGRTGLTRQTVGPADWDVYTVVSHAGVVQAAQRASAQQDEAAELAARLFLPAAVLVAVLGALLVYALRRGLEPLDRAAGDVAARSAASLAPIADDDLPREIRPLVQSINGLMQRLDTAFSAQRRFVADAAHELRTPVTALRLQLQLLDSASDEAGRRAASAELRAGIARAQHLIEQLLHLSRVAPDTDRQRIEAVSLTALVRNTVARYSRLAEHRGIDLGARAEDGISTQADRDELTTLLANLVENALRYTPRGGVVDVLATRLAGRPALQVIDNGPGVAEAERERVFDRFHRADVAPAHEGEAGSGLGLAIVKAIAERHGAEVSLHTAPSGQGLDVRVAFNASP